MSNKSYPLDWPRGWKRTQVRRDGAFRAGGTRTDSGRRVELEDAVDRLYGTLKAMGIKDDQVVISTNVRPTLGGRSGSIQVTDPGAVVYWTDNHKQTRCMAIDQYKRVPDNLAAIAATLEAMRAIERHGGAEILDRAFTGFTALPAPEKPYQVLGVGANASREEVERAYRLLASKHHPDKQGGDSTQMARINAARDAILGIE